MDQQDRETLQKVAQDVAWIRREVPALAKRTDNLEVAASLQRVDFERLDTGYKRDRTWLSGLVGSAWLAIIAVLGALARHRG
jgi:hypothetical protein